jgi:hypothetical protein
MDMTISAKPSEPKPLKPSKPTKKDVAAEKRIIQNFDNMVYLINSVTPEFIQTNIAAVKRATLTDASKAHISEEAKKIVQKAEENPKIVLPSEWDEMVNII